MFVIKRKDIHSTSLHYYLISGERTLLFFFLKKQLISETETCSKREAILKKIFWLCFPVIKIKIDSSTTIKVKSLFVCQYTFIYFLLLLTLLFFEIIVLLTMRSIKILRKRFKHSQYIPIFCQESVLRKVQT